MTLLAGSPASKAIRSKLKALVKQNTMLLAAILIGLAFTLASPVFGTTGNTANILRQTASVLTLGLSMTIVVLIGGIDLSVGSIVFASATVSGVALALQLPSAAALMMGIGTGTLVGLVNGLLVEGLLISPVIVTLGSMIAVRGLSLMLLGKFNSWVEIKGPLFDNLARQAVLGIPLDAIVALLASLILWFVFQATELGRVWHAIGDAPAASRFAGLRVRSLRGLAYVTSGTVSGVAGVLVAARTGLISPSIGQGLEFFAIAVVALGSGGLPAGRVTVLHTAIGALILMMIFNFMTIRGVPGTWQAAVTGMLLLAAIVGGRLVEGSTTDTTASEAHSHDFATRSSVQVLINRGAVIASTALLAFVFAVLNPAFLTLPNLIALIEQNAALAIIAVGATIGITSRCVDISPGSVVALGSVAAALAASHHVPAALALAFLTLTCFAVYALNGVLVGLLQLDPLIVTLAAWIWARGLAVSLTGANTIPFDLGFVQAMNTPVFFGFTPVVFFIVLAYALGWIVLSKTTLGLRIYAMGGDPRMVRQAGVNESLTRLLVLLAMSLLTAMASVVMLGRLGAAAPTAGFGLELDAIVAVIIGGASFRGGNGRLRDTAIGVLFLAILNNGLSGMQMGDAQFFSIKGSLILVALALPALAQLRTSRRG